MTLKKRVAALAVATVVSSVLTIGVAGTALAAANAPTEPTTTHTTTTDNSPVQGNEVVPQHTTDERGQTAEDTTNPALPEIDCSSVAAGLGLDDDALTAEAEALCEQLVAIGKTLEQILAELQRLQPSVPDSSWPHSSGPRHPAAAGHRQIPPFRGGPGLR